MFLEMVAASVLGVGPSPDKFGFMVETSLKLSVLRPIIGYWMANMGNSQIILETHQHHLYSPLIEEPH
jgi:hypothetical protein